MTLYETTKESCVIFLVMKKNEVYGTTASGKVLEFKTRAQAESWLNGHVYYGKAAYNFPDYWIEEKGV